MAKKNKKHPQEETELLEEQPAQQDDVSGAQRPRRKSGKSIVAIVLLVLAILLFVAGGALGLLYYQSYQDLEEMKAVVDVQGFYPGITIDGQDVGGRSYEEVREEILARQQAEADARVITVACEGQTYTLPAQSSYDTEQVIVDAYNYAKEGDLTQRYQLVTALQTQPLDFATTCTVTVEGVDAFVQRIAEAIDVPAQDATVGSFDVETKTFAFTDEVNGRSLDVQQLRSQIQQMIDSGDYSATITPVVNEVPAAITRAQLEQENQLLASFTTTTTSSSSRNTNIRLCSEAFNGYVVAPGEVFSINTVTGPRTTDKGYKAAGSIQNGILISEPGGGVCQVSSTLFNAVVRAGMEIVERWGHSWPSDYVKIGMDAAIDYPAKDFKFRNTSDAPIYLVTHFEDRQLTVEVYGKPVLEEGMTIDLRSTTDSTISRGEDRMVFDSSLAPGETKTVRKGRNGKKSTTYIQYIKDGKVVEEKVLFTTTYPAITAIINYGPEPTPEPTPDPTPLPEESHSNVWP
ncbi:MAG: VanW family protein [Candidatus Spyradocola sp.]|nr:VanW family protein [Candidatus Spyradocola sp.]